MYRQPPVDTREEGKNHGAVSQECERGLNTLPAVEQSQLRLPDIPAIGHEAGKS